MFEPNELWYTIEKRFWAVTVGLGVRQTDSKTGGDPRKVWLELVPQLGLQTLTLFKTEIVHFLTLLKTWNLIS